MSKIISDLFKRRTTPTMPSASSLYRYKTRFALLGTVGSGKSTVAAGIILTAQTLSADRPDFYGQVIESNSDIIMDTSKLKRGHFPKKTKAFERFPVESGLVLIWTSMLREKKVQIPICDIAGEDVQQMMKQSTHHLTPEQFNANVQLLNYVRDAAGFLICVPASRALMFHDDVQLEQEPSYDEPVVDPDVPVSRILNDVINYKAKTGGKSIEAIGVIITKWDLIAPYAMQWGIDLYDETGHGLSLFLNNYFAQTAMTLKPYVEAGKVHFFPSHFQVMRNADSTVKKWRDAHGNDMGDRIELYHHPRRARLVPRYSEQSYVNLFEWLRSFAT